MNHARLSIVATCLLACTGLGACATLAPTAAPVDFFVLSPLVAARSGSLGKSSLGVGPVRFPGYLTRPQMARRHDHSRIEYAEDARWAEPLAESFTAALAADISARLNVDRIDLYPWYASSQPDFTAEVNVLRFEEDGSRRVHLQAHWVVVHTASDRTRRGTTSVVELMAAPGPAEAARALSRATAALGNEIAAALSEFLPI